jgi:selenide, water dikinase
VTAQPDTTADPDNTVIRLTSLSHGAGCACKLPLSALDELMGSLGPGVLGGAGASPDLLVGAAEGDDAAVLRLDEDRALVLTTDFFTPLVDDPGDWGRIAAANALSDVYAMGGRPLIAVNLAAWPGETLPLSILADVLRGGAAVAAAAGCLVVGGHTIDDPEPKYGMAVVGLASPSRLLTIDAARPGDTLVLTKPVGTGVIATAHKRGAASAEVLRAAVASMTTLNAAASEAALAAGVTAATDVTGFSLLGHLHRMLRASGAAAEVTAGAVPLLPGALELTAAGYVSGGTRNNMAYLASRADIAGDVPADVAVLLQDAQTSGGLLLATAAPGTLVAELERRGTLAAVVGQVTAGEPGHLTVRP